MRKGVGRPSRPPTNFPRSRASSRQAGGTETLPAKTAETAAVATGELVYGMVSLYVPPGLSFEDCERGLNGIEVMGWAWPWWLGDMLIYIEGTHPEKFSQVVNPPSPLGRSITPEKANKAMWLCRRIDVERRRPAVSASHHLEVAGFAPEVQDMFLDRVEAESLTKAELREAISAWQQQVGPEVARTEERGRVRRLPVLPAGGAAESIEDAPVEFPEAPSGGVAAWQGRVAHALQDIAISLLAEQEKERDLDWLERRLLAVIERERTRLALGNGEE